MAIHSVSGRSTLVTATVAAALVALKAVTRPIYIREIHIFGVTAPTTSGGLGLCLSTAVGTGALTSVSPVARSREAPASASLLNTAWATLAPTNAGIGAVFERWAAPATLGNGIIWSFADEPIEVAAGVATSELCVVNTLATAPGTFDVVFIFSE